ncbi:MAG: AAA family ATPase [Coxiellaceae bacterium]|jgi:predicted AAA+ superfamily ATPase|nr:AAA family ATPase [Coxiellaceae bacterium]
MERIYETIVQQHFKQYNQMLFLSGPRRVGKTTISLSGKNLTSDFLYLNWDNQKHRQIIISGGKNISSLLNLDKLRKDEKTKPMVVFDEIHKYHKWKNFLKGFFDTYGEKLHIIVTGSSKLNIFIKGGR